ncbi:tRNA-splicing ligase RtcB [Tritrichomonas foetus]|uniref:RNA-splicing ligase RtcB homolog n=1 Tax=Tritrichomonas foetus TaxID=1144522 RepID=A0A1J4JDW0_9EUKA|nr:tRNA-splicing ligase RtcB [Tritrichomonas foetus]|eukprot:OHS95859.1 tRNA-splicing ligase RtcB [Tritrichomonas foetus]
MDRKSLVIDPSMIKLVEPCVYEIPIGFVPNMKVPGRFFATPEMAEASFQELSEWMENRNKGLPSILQIAFVASLDGVTKGSFAMPDMHSGYGFSIGGVAAFDTSDPAAIISPGGVGYDINCGVRCVTTNLTLEDVEPVKKELVNALYKNVPVGVGGKRKKFITMDDLTDILTNGAHWALKNGYATEEDINNCEENGRMTYADQSLISERAKERGLDQLGTLGAGNHYVEIQVVDDIFDQKIADVMGVKKGQIVVMIHTGSRGLGYQVADDIMKQMNKNKNEKLFDNQLNSPAFNSELGQNYLHSMGAAANFAWCNRQIITHFVRKAFSDVFQRDDIEMNLIYDVAHNIAKVEKHVVDGVEREFIVHRKGATRAFGPGRSEIPEKYREVGQPVLIGGSLGTASYILAGTKESMDLAFGSTCHGAGRMLSRQKALRSLNEEAIKSDLNTKGIEFRAATKTSLIEEAPEAYKDVELVVEACQTVGASKKVARLLPIGVIKG